MKSNTDHVQVWWSGQNLKYFQGICTEKLHPLQFLHFPLTLNSLLITNLGADNPYLTLMGKIRDIHYDIAQMTNKVSGGTSGAGSFNSSLPGQNGCHFANDICKRIFLNENMFISIKFSVKFIPNGPIRNIPALVQIMAWHWQGNKPLFEPMLTWFIDTHMRHKGEMS